MKRTILPAFLLALGGLALGIALDPRGKQASVTATPATPATPAVVAEQASPVGAFQEKPLERVQIDPESLPDGFSEEPVCTLNGAAFVDEETKWAWAYAGASVAELEKAREELRYLYRESALPELSKAMQAPERTREIGKTNGDGSWSFSPEHPWIRGHGKPPSRPRQPHDRPLLDELR